MYKCRNTNTVYAHTTYILLFRHVCVFAAFEQKCGGGRGALCRPGEAQRLSSLTFGCFQVRGKNPQVLTGPAPSQKTLSTQGETEGRDETGKFPQLRIWKQLLWFSIFLCEIRHWVRAGHRKAQLHSGKWKVTQKTFSAIRSYPWRLRENFSLLKYFAVTGGPESGLWNKTFFSTARLAAREDC